MHGNSTDGVNEESVVNEINGSVGSIKGNSVIDKSPEITSPRSPRNNSVDCPADDADVDHGIAVDHGVADNGRDNSVDCPPDDADVDHGVDDNGVIDTSIEQLYENVCDMQSSDQSPSRQSFGSAGEESRIDSELRHLVGGEMGEIEIMEEEEVNKPENGNHSDILTKEEEEVNKPENGNHSDILTKEEEEVNKPENGNHSDTLTKDVCPPASKKSGKLEKNQTSSTKSISSSISRKASRPTPDSEVSSKPTAQDKRPPEKPPIDKKDDKNLKKGNARVSSGKKRRNFPKKLLNGTEDSSETGFGNPDVARYLMKQAKDLVSAGDNLQKALELAVRASKSFEICSNGKPNLDLVMSLHVTAAIHCSLGQYSEAIPLLERSIEIPTIEEGQEHALAMFAGYMQLGDTYAMLGQLEKSTKYYITGLEVQKKVLGDTDPRVGETCRYLAEAHVQALQFDEAQTYCQMALDIHKENGSPATLEEAADRRLMGLICETKGDHEAALEHFVLSSMAMVANGHEHEVASIDCSIGDTYLSLSRYDEAIFAYQKALTSFKTANGENHPTVGSVFVRLAELYNRTGKLKEAKSYCESALRIYENPVPGIPPEDIASGLTDISAIYESMNELEQAIKLLQKALKIYDDAPGQQSTIAGIEAQMGVMYYMLGNFSESYNSFKNAISKLRASGEKKSAFFGIALNQMGLACVQRYAINEATELFEEAKNILELECGPDHPDTLGVYSNLAGTYDAMGRLDDAIEILDYVVDMREEKLGTANPDVDDEKRRLAELLKEAGRVRSRKGRSLEKLLDANSGAVNDNRITVS